MLAADRQARWALVGLGRLIQGHVLPAFTKCRLSKVTALVSGDPAKAGKRLRKDAGQGKENFVTLLGEERARLQAERSSTFSMQSRRRAMLPAHTMPLNQTCTTAPAFQK